MRRCDTPSENQEATVALSDSMKTWLKDARQQSEELKFLLEQSKRVASEATEAIKKDYEAQVSGLREQVSALKLESATSHATCKKSLQGQEDLKLELRSARAEVEALQCQLQSRKLDEAQAFRAKENLAANQLEKLMSENHALEQKLLQSGRQMAEMEAAGSLSYQKDLLALQHHLERTRATRDREREEANSTIFTLQTDLATSKESLRRQQELIMALRKEQFDYCAETRSALCRLDSCANKLADSKTQQQLKRTITLAWKSSCPSALSQHAAKSYRERSSLSQLSAKFRAWSSASSKTKMVMVGFDAISAKRNRMHLAASACEWVKWTSNKNRVRKLECLLTRAISGRQLRKACSDWHSNALGLAAWNRHCFHAMKQCRLSSTRRHFRTWTGHFVKLRQVDTLKRNLAMRAGVSRRRNVLLLWAAETIQGCQAGFRLEQHLSSAMGRKRVWNAFRAWKNVVHSFYPRSAVLRVLRRKVGPKVLLSVLLAWSKFLTRRAHRSRGCERIRTHSLLRNIQSSFVRWQDHYVEEREMAHLLSVVTRRTQHRQKADVCFQWRQLCRICQEQCYAMNRLRGRVDLATMAIILKAWSSYHCVARRTAARASQIRRKLASAHAIAAKLKMWSIWMEVTRQRRSARQRSLLVMQSSSARLRRATFWLLWEQAWRSQQRRAAATKLAARRETWETMSALQSWKHWVTCVLLERGAMEALCQKRERQFLSGVMWGWREAGQAQKESRMVDAEMTSLSSGVETIRCCLALADRRVHELVAELRETQTVKLPELEGEVVQVSQELELLQVQFEVKDTEINSARTQIAVLNDTIAEMRARMEAMQEHETSVGALQREMRSEKRELDRVAAELEGKERELAAVSSTLSRALEELAAATQRAEALETQALADGEALAREREGAEGKAQELRATVLAQLSAEAQAKEAELHALRTHVAVLQSALDDLRNDPAPTPQSMHCNTAHDPELGRCVSLSLAISEGIFFALEDVRGMVAELSSQEQRLGRNALFPARTAAEEGAGMGTQGVLASAPAPPAATAYAASRNNTVRSWRDEQEWRVLADSPDSSATCSTGAELSSAATKETSPNSWGDPSSPLLANVPLATNFTSPSDQTPTRLQTSTPTMPDYAASAESQGTKRNSWGALDSVIALLPFRSQPGEPANPNSTVGVIQSRTNKEFQKRSRSASAEPSLLHGAFTSFSRRSTSSEGDAPSVDFEGLGAWSFAHPTRERSPSPPPPPRRAVEGPATTVTTRRRARASYRFDSDSD